MKVVAYQFSCREDGESTNQIVSIVMDGKLGSSVEDEADCSFRSSVEKGDAR